MTVTAAMALLVPLLTSAGLGAVVPFLTPARLKIAYKALRYLGNGSHLSREDKSFIREYNETKRHDMRRGALGGWR